MVSGEYWELAEGMLGGRSDSSPFSTNCFNPFSPPAKPPVIPAVRSSGQGASMPAQTTRLAASTLGARMAQLQAAGLSVQRAQQEPWVRRHPWLLLVTREECQGGQHFCQNRQSSLGEWA